MLRVGAGCCCWLCGVRVTQADLCVVDQVRRLYRRCAAILCESVLGNLTLIMTNGRVAISFNS